MLRPDGRGRPSLRGPRQSQTLCDQILNPLRDHQRLRHAAQSREQKLFASPITYSGRELHIDFLSRNNCFLTRRDLTCELPAQAFHQFGDFDAQKSVVVGIAQIGLRKTGGNH